MDYNAIIEFKMNDLEAKAYRCCLIWEKICKKLFPKERYSKLRRSGDPRKSYLFKCCYSFINERRNVIAPDDFKLFIYAQLELLKSICNETQHADISPNCLLGDKAWCRWKIWQKKYNTQKAYTSKTIAPASERIQLELTKTKEYLIAIFGKEPTINDIQEAYTSRAMSRWFRLGKISPYFLVLFPSVTEITGWGIDLALYKEHMKGQEVQLKELFFQS